MNKLMVPDPMDTQSSPTSEQGRNNRAQSHFVMLDFRILIEIDYSPLEIKEL